MKATLIINFVLIFPMIIFSQSVEQIKFITQQENESALALCQHLHQNPELSFQEFETAKLLALELEKLSFEVTRNFGGNNVVGIYKNGNGPTIMLRTDMDALPIEEKTGLPFASTKRVNLEDGSEVAVMHACGHDIHMSVWLGSIKSLIQLKAFWKGTLLVIAQEAEEVSGGADKAIQNGLFQKFPVPDAALAFHINPELPAGSVGFVSGPVFAGVKTAEITVYGKGGHGAYPEKCIDPIVMASQLVLQLQTIVSREINPLDPAVISVGSIHGGTRPNIIPDEVKLQLTLRYYKTEVIDHILKSINRMAEATGRMAGMPEEKLPKVYIHPVITPPVVNHEPLASHINTSLTHYLGTQNIHMVKPAMVGEDFGKYGYTPENVPTNLLWLGSTNELLLKQLHAKGLEPAPLHAADLMPDYPKTIETGIYVMTSNVLSLMDLYSKK